MMKHFLLPASPVQFNDWMVDEHQQNEPHVISCNDMAFLSSFCKSKPGGWASVPVDFQELPALCQWNCKSHMYVLEERMIHSIVLH